MEPDAYFSGDRGGKLAVQGHPLTEFSPGTRTSNPLSLLSHDASVSNPLFAKRPAPGDVAQGGIGDCPYLAAALAILNLPEGPEIVLHMMRDLPPSATSPTPWWAPSPPPSVVVRLFDVNEQAHYLKLPRTIITNWVTMNAYADLLPQMGAWPVFLEKALTAFDNKGLFSPSGATYDRIEGAPDDRGLKLLLGLDTKLEQIPRQQTGWGPNGLEKQQEQRMDNLNELLCGTLDPGIHRQLLGQIFPGDTVGQYALWQAWLGNHPRFLDELRFHFKTRTGEKVTVPDSRKSTYGPFSFTSYTAIETDKGKVFNAQHLSNFITGYYQRDPISARLKPTEMPGVIAAVAGYARTLGALPGRRGSGEYAQFQLDFFYKLKRLHQEKKPIVVGTDVHYIGTSSRSETGHSAGEVKVKGLAARHEYAVLDVFEVGARRLIRLGNPWGQYGRAYLWQQPQEVGGAKTMTQSGQARYQARLAGVGGQADRLPPSMAVEIKQGVFDLDLYDLTKRFRTVAYCTEPPTLSKYLG